MKTIRITKSGDYRVELTHPGEEAEIIGRLQVSGTERVEVSLTIIHRAVDTSARTSIKAVVDDQAMVNLKGTIIVEPGAQKTNSFLEERVLLLSETAKAEAVPNLEIEANDVKCSHAATVGAIDPVQLFYLQSRGVDAQTAKQVIAEAFLA